VNIKDMSANSAPKHFLSLGLLFVIMAYDETCWGKMMIKFLPESSMIRDNSQSRLAEVLFGQISHRE
jgi:hypothetical protein